jgi:hypothetical protein
MTNVKFIQTQSMGEVSTHAIIEHADGSFTSMLKSTYDEQLAQSKETTTPQGGNE